MKTLTLIFSLSLLTILGFAQVPNWSEFTSSNVQNNSIDEVTRTRTAVNNAGDYLHQIANEFSSEVGKTLKANYPAKVSSIDIEFEYKNGKYTLTYTAWFEKCSISEHQYYFDHRGAMTTADSKDFAMQDASNRCKNQVDPAVQSFQKSFGSGELYTYYTYKPFLAESGRYTSLVEAFIVGQKK